jgi:DNA (cytosine-5)-methyltransferase 1
LDLTGQEAYAQVIACARQQRAVLGFRHEVSAREAISDLEVKGSGTEECVDPQSPSGFKVPAYRGPITSYQRLMHGDVRPCEMDSTRLARHSRQVSTRFERILRECRQGVRLDEDSRRRFGLEKHRIYPMAADLPAPTLTTLPDDVLHYSEPRILSVRETARLQSFPDWFVFRGKYTTGGKRRSHECPRYTQVGNAVPPLLARGLGSGLASLLEKASRPLR